MKIDNRNAYSLVELSISITIVAVLIASGLNIFTKRNEADKTKLTLERMAKIEESIINYIDLNGFIPCPAQGNLLESNTYFGDSIASTVYVSPHCSNNLNNYVGMVPVRNLNLEDKYAYDGWGRKFSFRVGSGLSSATDYANTNYNGDISVVDLAGNDRTNINSPNENYQGAAFIIISYGPDGLGAWSKNATTAPTLPATTSPEYFNVRHLTSQPSSIYIQDDRGYTFNDIISFKPKRNLSVPKRFTSPIKIPESTCTNATTIVNLGKATSSISGILGTVSSAIPTALSSLIYYSALNVQKLCNNPPIASINSTSSCTFNPISVPGLQAWYDANDTSGNKSVVADGTSVATWTDKSGNSRNAVAGGNATLKSTSGTPFVNNKPALYFNAASNNYYNMGSINYMSGTNFSIFAVAAPPNNVTSSLFLSSYPTSGGCGSDNCLHFGLNSYGLNQRTFFTGLYNDDVATPSFVFNSYTPIMWNYSLNTNSSIAKTIYIRSADGRTATGKSYITNTLASNINGQIGQLWNQGTYYTGYIAEILIYTGVLTKDQNKAIEGYLARKWFSGECQ
jgi:type II secretory pathway pseudopilin PulG